MGWVFGALFSLFSFLIVNGASRLCYVWLRLILLASVAWFKRSDTSLVHSRLVAEDSVQQRLVAYKLALLMSLAKPVFGYGRGDEPFAIGRAEYLARIESDWLELGAEIGPPHNQYLYTLVQYGLIGLHSLRSHFFRYRQIRDHANAYGSGS